MTELKYDLGMSVRISGTFEIVQRLTVKSETNFLVRTMLFKLIQLRE